MLLLCPMPHPMPRLGPAFAAFVHTAGVAVPAPGAVVTWPALRFCPEVSTWHHAYPYTGLSVG